MTSITQVPYPTTHPPALGIRLGRLDPGTPVTLVIGGQRLAVTVQRWSCDGAFDNGQVIVGYGPGRWQRGVSAAGILAGYYDLELESERTGS